MTVKKVLSGVTALMLCSVCVPYNISISAVESTDMQFELGNIKVLEETSDAFNFYANKGYSSYSVDNQTFYYIENVDEIQIVACATESEIIEIPAEIGGKSVTKLENTEGYYVIDKSLCPNAHTLNISENVNSINALDIVGAEVWKGFKVIVAEANNKYFSYDDNLFERTNTGARLVRYFNTDGDFTEDTDTIGSFAFLFMRMDTTEIGIPECIQVLEPYAFFDAVAPSSSEKVVISTAPTLRYIGDFALGFKYSETSSGGMEAIKCTLLSEAVTGALDYAAQYDNIEYETNGYYAKQVDFNEYILDTQEKTVYYIEVMKEAIDNDCGFVVDCISDSVNISLPSTISYHGRDLDIIYSENSFKNVKDKIENVAFMRINQDLYDWRVRNTYYKIFKSLPKLKSVKFLDSHGFSLDNVYCDNEAIYTGSRGVYTVICGTPDLKEFTLKSDCFVEEQAFDYCTDLRVLTINDYNDLFQKLKVKEYLTVTDLIILNDLGIGEDLSCKDVIGELDKMFLNASGVKVTVGDTQYLDELNALASEQGGKFTFVTSSSTVPSETEVPETSIVETIETTFISETEILETSFSDETEVSDTLTTDENVDVLLGDANCDGDIDIRDVTAIAQFIIKLSQPTKQAISNTDIIKDGKIDIKDLTMLNRYLIHDVEYLG